MIHHIDKCKYANPQIAQGAFGSISIAILHHKKENEPQQFSFVAMKTIRNALDSSSFSHQHGSCDNNNNNNNKREWNSKRTRWHHMLAHHHERFLFYICSDMVRVLYSWENRKSNSCRTAWACI
mmetsp:Transcript_5372/g.10250  ORF Transcript_5372/g.10250 Transcript_5372/m.10250 type:complete len:124 (+) Transcript_5372:66-437(+)